jgi:hypothetical protein
MGRRPPTSRLCRRLPALSPIQSPIRRFSLPPSRSTSTSPGSNNRPRCSTRDAKPPRAGRPPGTRRGLAAAIGAALSRARTGLRQRSTTLSHREPSQVDPWHSDPVGAEYPIADEICRGQAGRQGRCERRAEARLRPSQSRTLFGSRAAGRGRRQWSAPTHPTVTQMLPAYGEGTAPGSWQRYVRCRTDAGGRGGDSYSFSRDGPLGHAGPQSHRTGADNPSA